MSILNISLRICLKKTRRIKDVKRDNSSRHPSRKMNALTNSRLFSIGIKLVISNGTDMPIILIKFSVRRKTENLTILLNVSLFLEMLFFLMYLAVSIGNTIYIVHCYTNNNKFRRCHNVAKN